MFIPRGIELPNLDQNKDWEFIPNEKHLKIGQAISAGDELGYVVENELFERHVIMAPPKTSGRLTELMV